MKDFTFYNPTRIEFGEGKEGNIGQYIKEWFRSISAPVTLAEAGLLEDAVDPIAENAFGNAKLWGMEQTYPKERIAKILKLAVK
ncbi:uncharacterized protein Dvar_03370 [Desulfosarcina variabilis str. Montpellier]|uniref:hypothetical protein n=1 Tax=Desulfosarcina variabilis TaxID=2300 RepID=UPI003AFA441E